VVRPSLAFVIALVACRVPALDFTGKQCPCPDGYSCDTFTETCTRGDVAFDASPQDAPIDARQHGGDAAGSSYRDAVIADSPVAYWRLDDTGTTALDQMGHDNGTYSGTCTHSVAGALVGDPDTALELDGSSCEVVIADPMNQLEFTGTKPYSVEAWIDNAPVTVGFRVVYSKTLRMMNPIDGYALVDSTTGVYFERAVGSSAPTTAHTSHPNNTYVYLVGVYDGSAFELYIDGLAGAPYSDASTMPTYMAEALIGADSSGDHFAGSIDEVAVYGYALTAQQIATHYQIATGGP
jgi:trimeric autotransporter adhesin